MKTLYSFVASDNFDRIESFLKENSSYYIKKNFDKNNFSAEEGIKLIKNIVNDYFSCDLNLKTRERNVCKSRQVAQYFGAKYFSRGNSFPNHMISLGQVGYFFGEKKHSIIIYSEKAVRNLIDTDFKFRKDIENLDKIFMDLFSID